MTSTKAAPSSSMMETTDMTTAAATFTMMLTTQTTTAASHQHKPDMEVAMKLHWGMSCVLGPILIILGLVGNIFAIIVWNRPSMKSSTGRYLTAQAVADMGVLVMFLLADSVKAWSDAALLSYHYCAFFSYFAYPMFFLAIVCSIWFTVGVTVDRYILVCWIARAKDFCNEKRANFGILLITTLCFIVNMPHFWSYYPVGGPSSNHTGKRLAMTDFGAGQGGKMYEFWVHCMILVLVPWFTVFTLNMLIINKIGTTNRRMQDKKSDESMKKSRSSENQVTRLLLVVTFAFLFFLGMQCVIQCVWMLQPEGADKRITEESFAIAKMGIIFNSSFNFLFYCLSGKRFRRELLSILGWKKKDGTFSSLSQMRSTNSGTSTTGM